MLKYTHDVDVVIGLIKAFIYGGIIALISCYKGIDAADSARKASGARRRKRWCIRPSPFSSRTFS